MSHLGRSRSVEEISRPRFTQAELLTIVDVERGKFQHWVNRGVFRVSEPSPGTGNRRLYSVADGVRLHLLAELSALGIALSQAARWADHFVGLAVGGPLDRDHFLVVRPPSRSLPRMSVVHSSLGRWKDHNTDEHSVELFHGRSLTVGGIYRWAIAEPVFLVPLGDMVENILLKIDRLARD